MGLSLDKIEKKAPELLSLAKKAQDVVGDRLGGQVSRVALALDYSGSMSRQYASGAMQRLAEKVLALGTQLDDDGFIDLFLFDSSAAYAGEVTIDNFRTVVADYTRGRRMGSTNYADLFRAVVDMYDLNPHRSVVVRTERVKGGLFKKDTTREVTESQLAPVYSELPTLVVFLTDGSPDNRAHAVQELTAASYAPIFWQFLSIGNESMDFLQKLDDLTGRYIDNADYKPVGNVDRLTGERLFELLLDEYPGWVKEQRKRGNIA